MKLTSNFHLSEFNCRDGRTVPAELLPNVQELANNLQILRDELGEPIHINSCYRPPDYNKKVGGAKNSQHLTASAADIVAKSFTPKKLAAIVERLIKQKKLWFGGIGIYPGFIHVDIRKKPARW